MAPTEARISAIVSLHTRELLEEYCRASGVKKAHVVEMGLLHHLRALRELPSEVIIPPRIVVSRKSARKLAARIEHPPVPTKAMKRLMGAD